MASLKKSSIRQKLLSWYLLAILVPILLIGTISALLSWKIIRTQALTNAESNFNYITKELDAYTNNILNLSQDFLASSTVFDVISLNVPITQQRYTEINDYIRHMLLSNNNVQAVNIVIGDKQWRSSLRKNNIFDYGTVGYNDIAKLTSGKNGEPCWYISGVNSDISGIFFARTIHNVYTNDEKGLIIFELSRDTLNDIVTPQNTTSAGCAFILSDKNKYIAGADKNLLPALSEYALNNINMQPYGVTQSTDDVIFFRHTLSPSWRILYITDKFSLYRSSYLIICCVIVLCVISLLLLILFAKYINVSITSPIKNLAHMMQNWDENQISDIRHNNKSDDEISDLYNEFSRLTKRLNLLINQNYKGKIMLKESKIKMLQSQINPHFMFNTLEAINSMSMIYDVPEISNMITSLSDILDQCIGRTDRLITLSEEMHYIDSFIYIYQTRFPGKFEVVKNISKAAASAMMPPLLIQPIIENSLTHGIIPSDRECTLSITSYIRDNDVYVCISDNGIGIKPDKLAELNREFVNDDSSSEGSIGLINVNKRLKLYYGDEYHISISSEQDKFTSVTFRFCLDKLNLYNEEGDDENDKA